MFKYLMLILVFCLSCGDTEDISKRDYVIFDTNFERRISFSSCYDVYESFSQDLCFGKCINSIKGRSIQLSMEMLKTGFFWVYINEEVDSVVFFGNYSKNKISGLFTISHERTSNNYYSCFDDYNFEGKLL